jgi:hypothetical protein
MIRVKYQSPGGPLSEAHLMFGAEFHRWIRNGEPGAVRVITESSVDDIRFDEIVCDVCNAEVRPQDPCAMADRLYCWACAERYILPHVVIGLGVEVLLGPKR